MLCVALDEGLYECSFTNTGRSNDGYDLRRRIEGEAVDLGDVEAFLFNLGVR